MNRNTIIAAFFALVFLAGQNALAQSGYDLFQKGLVKERTEGNLDEAIRLYKQIVADHKDDRVLVAKTLVQMGGCYEKLGRAEARKTYQRVVQEFADQPEPVRVARLHLKQLDAGAPGAKANGPTYSLVLDDQMAGMRVGQRDFSPSGDRIVFGSRDKLYITDLAGTVTRPILDDMGPWEYPRSLRWSPDGRLIAYMAAKEVTSDSSKPPVWAIFVLSPDDGAPRQIGPERPWATFIFKIDWTPDGKHLFYLHEDGLHMLSLDGSEVRFIPKKDFSGKYPSRYSRKFSRCEYSPNGRWLAYCKYSKIAANNAADIWILPATGGQAQRLTNLSGNNRFPTWAPDGRALYFVSGTSHGYGERSPGNIWKLPMDPETGLAKGQAQQVTFFSDTRISISRVLGDGDRIAFQMEKTNTSVQVADASSPHEARTLVGGHSPQLSPDGQTIYYVNDTPGEEGIYAVPRQRGRPRRLTESLPAVGSHSLLPFFDISPDGRTLAYSAKLGERSGLFTLAASGGEPQLLVKFDKRRPVVPQWSPDGSQLGYSAGKGLYIIPAAGDQPRELAHLEQEWEEWNVRWSPDGKFLAAFSQSGGPDEPQNAVFVVPASGGKLRQLTPDVEYKEGLEWHPDGQRLTYHVSRYHSETRQAYLDGRPPSFLVDAPDIWDYVGIWAPDGRRFFFSGWVSDEKGGGGIYVYDEASGKVTLASALVPGIGVPRWSRDGKTMACWAARRTARQTWIMENFLPD